MNLFTFSLFLLAAYLIGAIPSGVVLTKLAGLDDIRSQGSGNIGATNVYRVAGRRLGVLTLVLDALKGLLPMLAAVAWLHLPEGLLGMIALALFLGHCYPVYLGFKGGKGVATALGIYLVLSPPAVLLALGLFIGLLWKWRFVSLGSVSAAAAIPFAVLLFEGSWPLFAATLVISALVILRHKANIQRLFEGTESRFRA